MKNNKIKGTQGFPLNLQAAVFDLDGTLMNTLEDISRIANGVLEDLGYSPIPKRDYCYFLGNGAGALLDSIHRKSQMKKEDIPPFDKAYMDQYERSEIGKEAIYPDINELLSSLKDRGVKLGVLTNKPQRIAIPLLERVFPNVFDGVFGQQDAYPRKPDPFGLSFLEKEMNFERDKVIYLGDTNTDMITGRAYGACTIGVLWGFRDKEELLDAGADIIIETPLELLDYLK